MYCRTRMDGLKLRVLLAVSTLGGMPICLTTASAVDTKDQPDRHEAIPLIQSTSLAGTVVDTSAAELRQRVVIIQFGGTDQANSLEQMTELSQLLATPALVNVDPLWLLVVSKMSDPTGIPDFDVNDGVKPVVIHDGDRKIFGDYKIVVLPTLVIADRNQHVVYTLAGPSMQFEVLAPAALRLATGELTQIEFDEILHPPTDAEKRSREKAANNVRLAERMMQRGLPDSADDLLRQAMELDPRSIAAPLKLGKLLCDAARYAEALPYYEKALELDPQSQDARLGLVASLLLNEENFEKGTLPADPLLRRIESILDRMVTDYPENPEAQYLQGVFFERQGDWQSAALAFKRAAALYKTLHSGRDNEP